MRALCVGSSLTIAAAPTTLNNHLLQQRQDHQHQGSNLQSRLSTAARGLQQAGQPHAGPASIDTGQGGCLYIGQGRYAWGIDFQHIVRGRVDGPID
jgi:hypothetical protein